jgi:hypothetical protein
VIVGLWIDVGKTEADQPIAGSIATAGLKDAMPNSIARQLTAVDFLSTSDSPISDPGISHHDRFPAASV